MEFVFQLKKKDLPMAIDCESLKKAHLNAVIAHIRKDAPRMAFIGVRQQVRVRL